MLVGDDHGHAAEAPEHHAPDVRAELVGVDHVDAFLAQKRYRAATRPRRGPASGGRARGSARLRRERRRGFLDGLLLPLGGGEARRADHALEARGVEPLGDLHREVLGAPVRADAVGELEDLEPAP